MRWSLLLLVIPLGCASASSSDPTILRNVECVPPDDPIPAGVWEAEIEAYEEADVEDPPAPGSIVFIGSSSIRFWETLASDLAPLSVLNRGFGGSVVAHATHFADRIVLPYEPDAIVLYAGDNDIGFGGVSPDCVLADFDSFVEKIQGTAPDTPIYFISIKPSIARWDQWPEMLRANELVEARTRTQSSLHFLDISEAMLDDDGEPSEELFVEDGLHMTSEGYALWTSLIRPVLVQDLGR